MPYLLPFTLSYSVILAVAYECAMSARASTRSTFSKFLHISHFVCKFSSRQFQSLSLSLSPAILFTALSTSFSGFYLFCIFITLIFIAQSCGRVRGRLLERLRLLRSTSKVSTEWEWEKREGEKEKRKGCSALRSVLRSGNNCQMPDNVYQVLRSLYPVITLMLCKEESKVKKEKTKKDIFGVNLKNSLYTCLNAS